MARAALRTVEGEPTSADRKRAEIVRLAAELFDRHGYHGTSVDDIADAAGIRKPTLYHYFSGKQEILFWINQEFTDIALRRQEERLRRGIGPADELLELMNDVISLLDTHPGHVRVYFEYEREIPEEYEREIKRQRRGYQRMAEATIARGIEEGEFRPVDVELTARAVFGMCNWTYQWYRKGGRYKARDVAEAFHDLLIAGMRVS